ncbi:uncharacterized protein LOC110853466 isoform X2 [Folsomia candida]|uniref:uncharacterized protein LOC110853466 isoform X2 n=1 Tax=Folsomia candida TaxID=158441 RepID=UPI001604D5AA|nr:uncharacterized protein LOC110853466 isoform X2 [Folsomia candida]
MSPVPEKTDPILSPNNNNNDDEIISKEFLQKALEHEAKNGDSVPTIISHSVTLGTKPGDNFMSIIYSVDVELSDGKKRHLLIKCYPNHPARQEFGNKSNMFFKEYEVYSKWIPELKRMQTEVLGLRKNEIVKLPYAHFVDGDCIDFQSEEGKSRMSGHIHSLDNFIMMEDLRKTYGFRMTNRREALDLDHTKLVISALAKVHALSWAYRHHVEENITEKFPCLVTNMEEDDMETWNAVLFSNLDQAKLIYDEQFGPGNDYSIAADAFRKILPTLTKFFMGRIDAKLLEDLMRVKCPDPVKFGRDAENPEPWRIICHGDCWSNNMLFKYDQATGKPLEVVLVDLQMPQESCVINDLQYVIFACTRLKLRQLHLDELLQLYHDTFNGVCALTKTPTLPGFCMDSLRFRFHRSKFLGYFMAIMVLPIMLKEEENAVNLEELPEGEDFTEIFANLSTDMGGNTIFKERLIEVTKGMIDEGILMRHLHINQPLQLSRIDVFLKNPLPKWKNFLEL